MRTERSVCNADRIFIRRHGGVKGQISVRCAFQAVHREREEQKAKESRGKLEAVTQASKEKMIASNLGIGDVVEHIDTGKREVVIAIDSQKGQIFCGLIAKPKKFSPLVFRKVASAWHPTSASELAI